MEDDNGGWENILHVKVEIFLTKPIASGRTVNVNGTRFWVLVKYEKLHWLCFRYGQILHETQKYKQRDNQRATREQRIQKLEYYFGKNKDLGVNFDGRESRKEIMKMEEELEGGFQNGDLVDLT